MIPCTDCGAEMKSDGYLLSCPNCPERVQMGSTPLSDMFRRNAKFTNYVRQQNPTNVNIKDNLSWLVFNTLALGAEWGELAQEIPWKWWKEGKIDEGKIAEELIDALHFMFNIFDELGYGPDDIYRAYVEKNEENWKRFRERWES